MAWLPDGTVATANEGDLFGGSRGFTHLRRRRQVLARQRQHVRAPGGASPATIPRTARRTRAPSPRASSTPATGATTCCSWGPSGAASSASTTSVGGARRPEFSQLLPAGLGPEGIARHPGAQPVVVTSSETDDPPTGVRTTISIYQRVPGRRRYPQVVLRRRARRHPDPVERAVGAGRAARTTPTPCTAVWDSYYAESRIFTLDVGETPAVVRASQPITGGTGGYDPEGLALAPDGTTWVASEGNAIGLGGQPPAAGGRLGRRHCRGRPARRRRRLPGGLDQPGLAGRRVRGRHGRAHRRRRLQRWRSPSSGAGTTRRPSARTSTTTPPGPTPASRR